MIDKEMAIKIVKKVGSYGDIVLRSDMGEVAKFIEYQDKEIERLNNIINEYDKWLNREIRYRDEKLYNQGYHDAIVDSKDKLKELKENK